MDSRDRRLNWRASSSTGRPFESFGSILTSNRSLSGALSDTLYTLYLTPLVSTHHSIPSLAA